MSDADAFMAQVETLTARAPDLAPLHAALLLAIANGIAADTRAFARRFGVAHALALRAVAELEDRFLRSGTRDPRTQRTRLSLTDAGRALTGAHAAMAA